ncbi:MAG: dehydrogenase [Rhodoglobus sp.]
MSSTPESAHSPDFSSPMLAEALKAGDQVAVALALRNDKVIVPMHSATGDAQVRVFRRGDADKYMLLLFSSVDSYVAMLPHETDHHVVAYTADDLRSFLDTNRGVVESIWFDVAGANPMQASPDDILHALSLT